MKKNVVRFRRVFHFNIGFVIFFIIIVYVLFNIYFYLTTDQISVYEVTQGTIASNHVYRGLLLREETVYTAAHTGNINYYLKNGSKASVRDVVYSIDTEGTIYQQISDVNKDGAALSGDSLSDISEQLSSFTAAYDLKRYRQLSSFKNDLNSNITQTLNTAALQEIQDTVARAQENNTFYLVSAKQAGVALYYTDGLESVTADSFTPEQVSGNSYAKTNLDTAGQVNADDPVYKQVTSESWKAILLIPKNLAQELKEESSVAVRFCEDGYETRADIALSKKEGNYYLILTLNDGMIRYAQERYTDIELILNAKDGLKIPNTAITQKDFFTIPKNYFITGNDSDTRGVLVVDTEDGTEQTSFVTPEIFCTTDDWYYVDGESLSQGDRLKLHDSDRSYYVVGTDIGSLEGVFNINKGYAVFKRIEILYQNEEYTIVEPKTSYGIALYDHIALDSSKVHENDFISAK